MVRTFKSLALAGAFAVFAAPAFAQVPPGMNPTGLDLDPFHIFSSPAPAPMAPAPMMMHHHRHMMMHKKMMMKKPMMMKKKMMMKKPMMKKM